MPTFKFTSPEGKVYQVTGPEGSTKDQAFSKFKEMRPELFGQPATKDDGGLLSPEAQRRLAIAQQQGEIPVRMMPAPEDQTPSVAGRMAAGVLSGAATAPEYIGSKLGILEQGRTEEALKQMLGIPESSLAFSIPKAATEIAGTMGAPAGLVRGISKVAPVLSKTPYINQLLASIEGGGLGEAAGANLLTRMAGGGVSGGIQGGLTGGEQGAGIGGGFGAALSAIGVPARGIMAGAEKYGPQVAEWATRQYQTIKNAPMAKLVESAGSKIDDIISALGKEGAIVPGTQPHAGEAAVKAGSTGFSSLVANTLENIKKIPEMGDILADRTATNMLARDLYNKGLFNSAAEAEQALVGMAGKPGSEQAALKGLKGGMAAEEEALAGAAQRAGAEVRPADQIDVGQRIAQARAKQISDITKEHVTPFFEKAKAYPTPFEVSGLASTVDKIKAKNTTFGQDLTPDTAALIDRLKPTEIPGKTDAFGFKTQATTVPPEITMNEAIELNKALNREYAGLMGSTAPGAKQTLSDINQLRSKLQATIKGKVPEEISSAFDTANKNYSKMIAKPFYETEFANIERTNVTGQPMLQPSETAKKILAKPEFAQQFARQMENSPEGKQAAMQGIEDLFMSKAVKNGVIDPEKAAAFIKDNAAPLKYLKQGGIDVESRLNSLVQQGRQVAETGTEAAARRAGLEFKTPEDMRASFIKNPALIDDAATYMGQADKEGLSRGFMQDAFNEPGKASGFLSENKEAIKKSLEVSHPGQADALYQDAVSTANIYDAVIKNQKLIGDINPMISKAERLEKIANLTKNLSPSQMRDVSAIERDVMRTKEFERLAAGGVQKSDNMTEEAIKKSQLNPPSMFLRIVTFAKDIVQKTAGKIGEKQAIELAKTFLEPKLTQQALKDAKAWQAQTLLKGKAAAKATKAAVKGVSAAGRGASRATVIGGANLLAPENQNRNALAR